LLIKNLYGWRETWTNLLSVQIAERFGFLFGGAKQRGNVGM
jgi:hypothetical protein